MRSSCWNHRPIGWRRFIGLARTGGRGFPTRIISGTQKGVCRLSKMIPGFRYPRIFMCKDAYLFWIGRKKKGGNGNGKGRKGKIDVESKSFPPPSPIAFCFHFYGQNVDAPILCVMFSSQMSSLSIHPGRPCCTWRKEKESEKKKKIIICIYVTLYNYLRLEIENFQDISFFFFNFLIFLAIMDRAFNYGVAANFKIGKRNGLDYY